MQYCVVHVFVAAMAIARLVTFLIQAAIARTHPVRLGRAADHESEVPNINVYLIITLANSSLLIIIPFTLHSFGNPRSGE